MLVCCKCCVLSGRSLCDELITRPEESYRLWCVVVGDLETSRMRRPRPALGRRAQGGGPRNLILYNFNSIRQERFRTFWIDSYQDLLSDPSPPQDECPNFGTRLPVDAVSHWRRTESSGTPPRKPRTPKPLRRLYQQVSVIWRLCDEFFLLSDFLNWFFLASLK